MWMKNRLQPVSARRLTSLQAMNVVTFCCKKKAAVGRFFVSCSR